MIARLAVIGAGLIVLAAVAMLATGKGLLPAGRDGGRRR